MDFGRIVKAAETLAHVAQAARKFRDGIAGSSGATAGLTDDAPPGDGDALSRFDNLAAGNRIVGQLEARLAGVLVSALKEAFDRDRAHLDMEREQIEHERKRADELMRLDLVRQAGDRELQGIRASVIVVLVVWITSVLFLMLHGPGHGLVGLTLAGVGWALLLAALAASFVAFRQVSQALALSARDPVQWNAAAHPRLAPAVSVLIVLGLGCTAASLLVALIA